MRLEGCIAAHYAFIGSLFCYKPFQFQSKPRVVQGVKVYFVTGNARKFGICIGGYVVHQVAEIMHKNCRINVVSISKIGSEHTHIIVISRDINPSCGIKSVLKSACNIRVFAEDIQHGYVRQRGAAVGRGHSHSAFGQSQVNIAWGIGLLIRRSVHTDGKRGINF